jgi:hypothetical protein
MVTSFSCIACNSADWVRGEARLISSAIRSWQKIGPSTKRKARLPSLAVSSTSEPRISAGIRSGVNWMRLAFSPITVPSVSTSRVLPKPGRPTSSAWPPQSMLASTRSTTFSCPMKRRLIEAFASPRRRAQRLDFRHQRLGIGHA